MSKKVLSIVAIVVGFILLILDAIWIGFPKHDVFNRTYVASVICIIGIILILVGVIGTIYYWEE